MVRQFASLLGLFFLVSSYSLYDCHFVEYHLVIVN